MPPSIAVTPWRRPAATIGMLGPVVAGVALVPVGLVPPVMLPAVTVVTAPVPVSSMVTASARRTAAGAPAMFHGCGAGLRAQLAHELSRGLGKGAARQGMDSSPDDFNGIRQQEYF